MPRNWSGIARAAAEDVTGVGQYFRVAAPGMCGAGARCTADEAAGTLRPTPPERR